MLKLYKAGDITHYWEAWCTTAEVTIHWGVVGENGETREIQFRPGENPNSIIEREAKQPKAEGYRKIQNSTLSRLIIQYRIEGLGKASDLDKRIKIEQLMNECLGWRGLGHCDGGDLGSGTMNIFCFVVDAKKAVPHILDELKTNGLVDGAVLAVGPKAQVVWPENFKGDLSI
jgi:predicted DNA-binding WGR domain protein